MNKQIEELAKDIVRIAGLDVYGKAEELINLGYQKVNKDQVVVLKTEYERLIYVEGELQEMNADYYNELKELKDSLKDSVVLTTEEYDNLKLEIQKAHHKGVRVGFDLTKFKENSIEQARKETAEKIFKMLISELESNKFLYGKRIIMEVDVENLAKQFGVEVDSV